MILHRIEAWMLYNAPYMKKALRIVSQGFHHQISSRHQNLQPAMLNRILEILNELGE
jgi:hypothetical protein